MALAFLKTKIEGMVFTAERVLLYIDVFVKKTLFVRILKITLALPQLEGRRELFFYAKDNWIVCHLMHLPFPSSCCS